MGAAGIANTIHNAVITKKVVIFALTIVYNMLNTTKIKILFQEETDCITLLMPLT